MNALIAEVQLGQIFELVDDARYDSQPIEYITEVVVEFCYIFPFDRISEFNKFKFDEIFAQVEFGRTNVVRL